jgi:hypothetical protein
VFVPISGEHGPVSSTDWSGVADRVARLREHPRRHDVFGSDGHGFALAPPLTVAELAELETWLGVSLPGDYRNFLTEVGAGGAGPFYGLFPIRRGADGTGWEWSGDGGELTNLRNLAEAFPIERVPEAILDALEAQRPKEADFDSDDELDAALDGWDERLEELLYQPAMTVGAICLADEGCAYRDWLIVSGPARGTMWEDPRCIDLDLKPMRGADGEAITFGNWYLGWLAACEETVGTILPA